MRYGCVLIVLGCLLLITSIVVMFHSSISISSFAITEKNSEPSPAIMFYLALFILALLLIAIGCKKRTTAVY